MASFEWPPTGGNQIAYYSTFSALPSSGVSQNALAITQDTGVLYEYIGTSWVAIGGPGAALALGNFDSSPNAQAATLTSNTLVLQPASATFPGGVSTTTQSFAGNKTFTGTISASNLSGTNTGDVTLGTANGLSLSAQVLSLGTASTSTTGALTSTDWNTFNGKQAAGSYITSLTGDVTATGPGAATAALVATTNATLTTLSGLTTASNLTTIGTITSGTWNGTTIAVAHGGTGTTNGSITGTGTLTFTAGGSNNNIILAPIGTGGVGIGTNSPNRQLEVDSASGTSTIRIASAGSTTSHSELQDSSSTQFIIRKTVASGAPIIDLTTTVGDATSTSSVRLFRDTNSAGHGLLLVYRGDGTSTVDAQIQSGTNGNTFFAANGGSVGIGMPNPSAYLHIRAGTAAAGTAPIKLTAGTNLTTAVAGAIEFDGTNFYITPVSTRLTLFGNPMTTGGDVIYGGASGVATRLANGTSGQALISAGGTAAPAWTSFKAPTIQKFETTGSTTGYVFTISTSTTCAVGDTYTNNGNTYTVLGALSAQSGQVFFASGAGAPTASGTLTRATGAGTSSVTFSLATALATYTAPAGVLYVKIRAIGGGAGGEGSGTSPGAGGAGGNTFFGPNILTANGAAAGGPGAGGTASLGTAIGFAIQGGTGGESAQSGTASTFEPGGMGAASPFGGAGGAGGSGAAGNAAVANSGSGGGGAGSPSAGASGNGGSAGGYLDAMISPVLTTYPYCVALGGSAGGAGGTGFIGGAGGSGYIIVEEFYT